MYPLNFFKLQLTTIGLLLITGCASGPVYSTMKNEIGALPDKQSRIVFYRPKAVFGFAMKSDIFLDNKKVGESRNGTVFYFDTLPGKHQVGTSVVIHAGDEHSGEIELRQGETIYVKTYISAFALVGRTNFEVVKAEQAKEEGIDDLVFISNPLD